MSEDQDAHVFLREWLDKLEDAIHDLDVFLRDHIRQCGEQSLGLTARLAAMEAMVDERSKAQRSVTDALSADHERAGSRRAWVTTLILGVIGLAMTAVTIILAMSRR